MKTLVCRSVVTVIGNIWQPGCGICSLEKTLSAHDVENCRDKDGKITRDSVEHWVLKNFGDFEKIIDFKASIEDGPHTLDFDWENEDSEEIYCYVSFKLDTIGYDD